MNNLFLIFTHELLHLIKSILPFFLIGISFAALIQTYVKTGLIIKYLNKGLGPIINASLLGAVLPGCSCTTMPVAKGLHSKVKVWERLHHL